MDHLAQGWDKFVDVLGRMLMHPTNSAAAGRASHSGTVNGQAFNGPIYPAKPASKAPVQKDEESDVAENASSAAQMQVK
ncbi:hypothetical protein VTI74DRAFT_4112 [Chaetomium olivicolor]